jgi:hypothetical protein
LGLIGAFIIGTLLWTTNAIAVNDTEWRVKGGASGRECSPVSPGKTCFWAVNATGNSPLLGKRCGKMAIWSHDSTVDTEGLVFDVYVCKNSTFADCKQLSATNLRTGTYGVVTIDDTDWSVLNIPYGSVMLNVTNAGTCGSPDCHVLATCVEN